jgi:hypothetical protein
MTGPCREDAEVRLASIATTCATAGSLRRRGARRRRSNQSVSQPAVVMGVRPITTCSISRTISSRAARRELNFSALCTSHGSRSTAAWVGTAVDSADWGSMRTVGIARDTAEALASLGVLYGAEPTLWILDESYICYANGEASGSSSSPPVVEGPTFRERVGVAQDRTAEGLQEVAEQLGQHLPVRDPELHAAATLLGWLREARTSPAPVRLVLFDRVVEAACGWAGIQSVPRFVREALIPWWAYARIRQAVSSAGFAATSGGRAGHAEGSPERTAWLEIVNHPHLAHRAVVRL